MLFSRVLQLNPYRLFFPLAIVCGLLGVGHWALFSVGYIEKGSNLLHGLIQSEGFLGLVAVGFLMTFLPRTMGVKEADKIELWPSFVLSFLIPGGFLAQSPQIMTAGFLAVWFGLIFFAARRIPQKTKSLPAPLTLLFFGLFHAAAGGALIMRGLSSDSAAWVLLTGRSLLQVGFMLCLVMGMTGFLMPFITGQARDTSPLGSSRTPHTTAGLLILLSFGLDLINPEAGAWLRALTAFIHMSLFAGIWRRPVKKTPYVRAFRWSGLLVPTGLLGAALFPTYRVAMLHVTFIGGFSLMIFSFGTLVVLSHSAQAALLNKPLKILWAIYGLILLSMGLRLAADFSSEAYMFLIHYAAGFWMAGAFIWLGFVWKKLWINPLPEG